MDLDDSFTAKLLQRVNARKENFKSMNDKSTIPSKKRPVFGDEDNLSNQGFSKIPEDSPKRQCREHAPEKENVELSMEEDATDSPFVPFTSSKSKGLAALKRNYSDDCDENNANTNQDSEIPASKKPIEPKPLEMGNNSDDSKIEHPRKECQNAEVKSARVTTNLPKKVEISKEQAENLANKLTFFGGNIGGSRDSKAVNVQAASRPNPVLDRSLDPAELPLSARKALFEKAVVGMGNRQEKAAIEPKLSVAQRAALFENASKINMRPNGPPFQRGHPVPKQSALPLSPIKNASPQSTVVTNVSPIKKVGTLANTPSFLPVSPLKKVSTLANIPSALPASPVKIVGSVTNPPPISPGTLMMPPPPPPPPPPSTGVIEEKHVISNLVNHWEKLSSCSSTGNSNSEEEPAPNDEYESEEYEGEGSEYTERESEYSEGREEESEFAEEENEDEMPDNASESDDSYFHHDEFNAKRFSSEAGLPTTDTDSYLATDEEVRSNAESDFQQQPDPSEKYSTSSSSGSRNSSCSYSHSDGSTSSIDSVEQKKFLACAAQSEQPLAYTVSFYRKQRLETRTPPVQTIVRREQVKSPTMDENQSLIFQERIKQLQEEITRQQTVIGQTSQALNLCHNTAEFSGSSEQVEGERLLLIATQKRQACLSEIQRLKSLGASGESIPDGTGTLTISDIQLPLKRDFITAQAEGKMNDVVHWFLCLIRHGAQVIVSQMVSSTDRLTDGSLCFTNHIKLQNLPPDFSVVVEVYTLQTKKEMLPHDKKYHIRRDNSKMRLTPKGKKSDGKLLFPTISSPGGPSAVRSPSFGVVGFTRFNIQNCNRKCFSLDKVPYASPLDGILKVKLRLHSALKISERGFLTMFEDVSGFGAWHRRWCFLEAHQIRYWKYPDDEHKKEHIGCIDLRQCVTPEVKLVSREICARPHTLCLQTVRPQEEGDKNTLITRSANTLTSTRHLLSADTKEERILWCNKMNEALASVRKWDPTALRAIETKQEG